MKTRKTNSKTRTAVSWEKVDETGESWADVWKPRVWEHCKCCLEANSKQQKKHNEMSVYQHISGWSVESSMISQMMIGANEPVGKYEGQKTKKKWQSTIKMLEDKNGKFELDSKLQG